MTRRGGDEPRRRPRLGLRRSRLGGVGAAGRRGRRRRDERRGVRRRGPGRVLATSTALAVTDRQKNVSRPGHGHVLVVLAPLPVPMSLMATALGAKGPRGGTEVRRMARRGRDAGGVDDVETAPRRVQGRAVATRMLRPSAHRGAGGVARLGTGEDAEKGA